MMLFCELQENWQVAQLILQYNRCMVKMSDQITWINIEYTEINTRFFFTVHFEKHKYRMHNAMYMVQRV